MKSLKLIAISCLFFAQFADASNSYYSSAPDIPAHGFPTTTNPSYGDDIPVSHLRRSSPTDTILSGNSSIPKKDLYRSWIPKIDVNQLCTEKKAEKPTFYNRVVLNRDSILATGGILLAGTGIFYGIKDKSLLRPALGLAAGYGAAVAIEKVQTFDKATKCTILNGNKEAFKKEGMNARSEYYELQLNTLLAGQVSQSWKDGFSAMFNVWNHVPSVPSDK